MDLKTITGPEFLKTLSFSELEHLAGEIRTFIIENVSLTGGHLSSNLGVVEMTIALHKVFDSPIDKLIFDVGHQGYTHKILTGRAKDFPGLRQYGGISGFLKQSESVHDVWEAGHSSTAIAAAAGFEYARAMNKADYHVVAVVGDGSLNSGLSFEALNYLGHNQVLHPIILLNDNEMSISKNVGTLAKLLTSMRSSSAYQKATRKHKWIPAFLYHFKDRLGMMMRGLANNVTIFDDLGIKYYGPIDGHNIKTLVKYLNRVKTLRQPCVLHIVTKKGKGYPLAEHDIAGLWHGVKPFDPQTGLPRTPKKENMRSWSSIISDCLMEYADQHPEFRVIVPAMIVGSSLGKFQQLHPDQLIDVGICESFSVCFASAIAEHHKKVFVPIYSSFIQRAYDQVVHDVARINQHVVFGIDRSGLVGEDGETHHGVFDIAFLGHIPNLSIVQPKDAVEAKQLFTYALDVATGPVAIRYSNRSLLISADSPIPPSITAPSWECLRQGSKLCVIAYGDKVNTLVSLAEEHQLPITIYNARFIKPLDTVAISNIVDSQLPILVVEDVVSIGGLGSMMFLHMQAAGLPTGSLKVVGIPDKYIGQGDIAHLEAEVGLDEASLVSLINKYL